MKRWIVFCFLFLPLPLLANSQLINKNVELITTLYADLEKNGYTVEIVEKYFDPAYIQDENGQLLDYNDFLSHVRDVAGMAKKVRFLPFDQVIAQNDLVIVRYKVRATLKEGTQIAAPMIAIYQIKNGKVLRLWEAGVTSDMVKNSDYIKYAFEES